MSQEEQEQNKGFTFTGVCTEDQVFYIMRNADIVVNDISRFQMQL